MGENKNLNILKSFIIQMEASATEWNPLRQNISNQAQGHMPVIQATWEVEAVL